jgi:hypothetical protein
MMVASIAMALMKAWAQRSYLVAICRQVLESAERALDAIPLFVRLLIVFDRFISAGPAGNAGFDAETCQSFTEPIAVIALVGDEHVGVRQGPPGLR